MELAQLAALTEAEEEPVAALAAPANRQALSGSFLEMAAARAVPAEPARQGWSRRASTRRATPGRSSSHPHYTDDARNPPVPVNVIHTGARRPATIGVR